MTIVFLGDGDGLRMAMVWGWVACGRDVAGSRDLRRFSTIRTDRIMAVQ